METEKPERKHLSKHSVIMLLCCLVPLAIIAVLWAVGVSEGYLFLGVLLLCPLLHIVMMRGTHGGGEHDHH